MNKFLGLILLITIALGSYAQSSQPDSLKKLLKKPQPDSEKVKIYLKLAESYRTSQAHTAILQSQQAALLARQANWPEGVAMAYEALAYDYFSLKKIDSSIYFANKALQSYEAQQMLMPEAAFLLTIGWKLQTIQRYAESKKYLLQALELYRQLSSQKGELAALEALGWFYHDMANFHESNQQFAKAMALAQKQGNAEALAHLNAAFGNNYIALRDYPQAQQKYFESARYFKEKGDIANHALYLATAANLYRRLNQLQKAEAPLLEAYKMVKQGESLWNIATISRFVGMFYTDMKKYAEAAPYLLEANKIATSLNSSSEIIKSYYALERFYYLKNDEVNGDKYQKLIISMRDSLYNTESTRQLAEFDIKYKTAEQEKQLMQVQLDNVRKRNWIIGISTALILLMLLGGTLWYIQGIKHGAKLKDLTLEHTQRILHAREQERQRIAKELHDSVGSQLTIVSTSLDNACFLAEKNRLTPQRLDEINSDVRETVQSLRDTIWATHHTTVSTSNLYARIQQYLVKVFADREQISYKASLSGPEKELNSIEALNLFRIFQEALQNILKHAQATHISLALHCADSHLQLTITDNGTGFDTSNEQLYESFGLHNMKNRSEEMNATLSIHSVIGAGTTLEIIKKHT